MPVKWRSRWKLRQELNFRIANMLEKCGVARWKRSPNVCAKQNKGTLLQHKTLVMKKNKFHNCGQLLINIQTWPVVREDDTKIQLINLCIIFQLYSEERWISTLVLDLIIVTVRPRVQVYSHCTDSSKNFKGKGQFSGLSGPLKSIVSQCWGVRSKNR